MLNTFQNSKQIIVTYNIRNIFVSTFKCSIINVKLRNEMKRIGINCVIRLVTYLFSLI